MENNQIFIINDLIDSSKIEICSSGVSYGLGGISLFKYYLHLLTKDQQYLEDAISYLDDSMNLISSENYSPIPDLNTELIELATLIHYYLELKIVKRESVIEFLDFIDSIIDDEFSKKLECKKLSPSSGLVYFGSYYLRIKKFKQVNEVINAINEKAVTYNNGYVWQSDVERKGEYFHELGIYHGSAGILNFLLECLKEKVLTQDIDIREIINKGIVSIISLQKTGDHNFFPSQIEDIIYPKRSNLIYGDLGISTILYKSGKVLKNECLKENAKKIFARCLKDSNKITKDEASLIFGTSGIYALIGLLELENNLNIDFNKKEIFELVKKEEKNNYHPQLNKFILSSPLSFSSGASGVGIALIASKIKNYDFLNFLNYKL